MSKKKEKVEAGIQEKPAIKQVSVRPQPIVYCGPSLFNILPQFTVFNNGIPQHLKEHIEKCPAIQELIVPVSELQACRKSIEKQGSKENTMYSQIVEYARSEK